MSSQKSIIHSATGIIRLDVEDPVRADMRTRVEVSVSGAEVGTRVDVRLMLTQSEGVTMEPGVRLVRIMILAGGVGSRPAQVMFRGQGACVVAAHAENLVSDFCSMTVHA